MFFTDKEKEIYTAPDGRRFDPLRVDRLLVAVTGNRLHELVTLRNLSDGSVGDMSKQGKQQAAVEGASAELELADAARKVFEFPPFYPDGPPDAVVLETLYDFMGWMEGKEQKAGTPQQTPQTECESSAGPTTNGSPSDSTTPTSG